MTDDAQNLAGDRLGGAGPGTESRARAVLGLDGIADEPRALPIRVERWWRGENFSSHVPCKGSILLPLGRAPDMGICRESIAIVARRHEALHSRLAVVNDRGIMISDSGETASLDVVELPRADIQDHIRRPSALSEFFAMPFDLFEESGFRCRAFRDEDENVTLGISMHHFFGDAWSSQTLRREIRDCYAAIAGGAAPDWQPPAQYSEYALSQRRALARDLPAQLAYWRQRLADAQPTKLPFDRQGDAGRLGRTVFTIPADLLAKLALVSRSERISLPMISLAAYQLALAHWCGQTQAVTAVMSADRMQPRFRNTVGHLMAAIPICSEPAENSSVRDFLSVLAKDFYGAMARQDLAFEQYQEIFAPPAPFCPTRFNFIPYHAEFSTGGNGGARLEFSGILGLADIAKDASYRDLHFLLMQYPDGLVGRVIHSLDLSSEKIESFIALFARILDRIADNPDGKLGGIF